MIEYGELHFALKGFIMFILFLGSVFSLCAVPLVFSKKGKTAFKRLLPFLFAVSFVLTVFLSLEVCFKAHDEPLPDYIISAFGQPALLYILPGIISCGFFAVVLKNEKQFRKNNITVSSIKESIDNLPDGICYAKENGLIILSNRKLDKLVHTLTGQVFADANRLWSEVVNAEEVSSKYIFLPDGTIWSFKRENTVADKKSFIKITATDVTKLYNLSTELAANNEKLKSINRRLKDYSQNVDEVVRSRERLETKMRIHSDFGQVLLATKYALSSEEKADFDDVIGKWRFAIGVFSKAEKSRSFRNHWHQLLKVANDMNVEIKLQGELPNEKGAKRLVCLAVAEALTNAIRHAGATVIFVKTQENDGLFFCFISNNGAKPEGEIKLGGGLGSLKQKIEEVGGIFEVGTDENGKFILTVGVKNQ